MRTDLVNLSRRAGLAGLLLATAVLVGCDDEDPAGGGADGASWTRSEDPVDPTGLVWATEGIVRLGDDTTIDTGEEIESYVVAGDGIYFVPASPPGAELMLATTDGVESTGAIADPATLRTSPDGRYLAFIDRTTGPDGGGDTPLATAVVVDLSEGEEVVRSSDAMGDPDDDLRDDYEEQEPTVFGLTDDTAYVGGPDGAISYELATGEGSPAADSIGAAIEEDWYEDLRLLDATTNPAGTWSIEVDFRGRPPRLVPTSGEPVTTRAAYDEWVLNSWLDDDTAVGSTGGADGVVLLTCAVPTGACEPVPGTETGVLLPVDRLGLDRSVVRTPRRP